MLEHDTNSVWVHTEDPPERRDADALLRASEHVTVLYVLDETVPVGEAWVIDPSWCLPRWRINPVTLQLWHASSTAVDWRTRHLTPEDFYAT